MNVFAPFRQLLLSAVFAVLTMAQGVKGADEAGTDQEQGVKYFYEGRIKEAIAAWDRHLAAHPADKPNHWQRGIALYYAERYAEGRAQFEEHQKVNSRDVENAAWHFICVAREKGVDEARKALIPIEGDLRVPMKEIYALFADKGSEAAVIGAAKAAGRPDSRGVRNALCYAHLYLGLYYEATGNADKAKEHMLKSAFDYGMDHFMGRTARIHCQLRGWKIPDAGEPGAKKAEEAAKPAAPAKPVEPTRPAEPAKPAEPK